MFVVFCFLFLLRVHSTKSSCSFSRWVTRRVVPSSQSQPHSQPQSQSLQKKFLWLFSLGHKKGSTPWRKASTRKKTFFCLSFLCLASSKGAAEHSPGHLPQWVAGSQVCLLRLVASEWQNTQWQPAGHVRNLFSYVFAFLQGCLSFLLSLLRVRSTEKVLLSFVLSLFTQSPL